MKKILVFMFLPIMSYTWAQSKTDFEKFINLFPLYEYPYQASTDFMKATKVNSYANPIDTNLLRLFVYDQDVKKTGLGCELSNFESFFYYIQLPSTDSVFVITLSPNTNDAACGSGLLLVTYSKFSHRLQDTLWISIQSGLPIQYLDGIQVICNLDIESILTKDSICVKREEIRYLRYPYNSKTPSKKIKISTFYLTYQMTIGGKFIKIRERKEEEILDPIANQFQ